MHRDISPGSLQVTLQAVLRTVLLAFPLSSSACIIHVNIHSTQRKTAHRLREGPQLQWMLSCFVQRKRESAEGGCIGFVQTGFGGGGLQGRPHVRQSQCQMAPGWTLPLATAEPVRNYSNASVITYFRRKTKLLCRCNCGQRGVG